MTRAFVRIVTILMLLVSIVLPIHAQERGENGCLPALALTEGQIVTIIGGVYIRAQPDLDSGIVAYSPERIPARVLGGPVCADGFNWWNVEKVFGEVTFKGWVAQQLPNKLFVIPNDPVDLNPACPEPLPVPIGTAVETFDGIRVRTEPSTSSLVLTVAQPETTALVLEGPTCAEGFNWWRVQIQVLDVQYVGWIVEGIPVLPTGESNPLNDPLLLNAQPDAGPSDIPCGPAAPLEIGAIGVVRFEGPPLKNLRAAPTTIGEILYNLPSGITVEILSAPFCNEGVNWRQVRVRGGSVQPVGWMAEGVWLGRFRGAAGEDYDQPAP
jgi:hypothetical protein